MAVVIPYVKNPTWADGSGGGTSIDAADLNKMEDGIFDAHNMPAVRVRWAGAAQATVSGTPLNLAFDTELYDTDVMHDNVTSNSRLTAKHAGVFDIGGCIEWSANPVDASLILFLNAATVIAYTQVLGSGDARRQTISAHYKLAINDFVELRVIQSSGSGKNVNTTSPYSPSFWMARIATG